MKKIILIVSLVFFVVFSQAQISLAKPDGTPINNGQIFTYNTTNEDAATFKYKIINASSAATNVKIKVVNIVNATGNNVQFCYLPTCLFSIVAGNSYPPSSTINIGPSSETPSAGFNFWNYNTGDGVNYPIDYVFKFYQVNSFGSEIGNSVTITYRYNPNAMSVSDVNSKNNNFAIVGTKIGNTAEIIAKDQLSYSIYNMNGILKTKGKLEKGSNTIDTSSFNSGIYMIQLQNKEGETITRKLSK